MTLGRRIYSVHTKVLGVGDGDVLLVSLLHDVELLIVMRFSQLTEPKPKALPAFGSLTGGMLVPVRA